MLRRYLFVLPILALLAGGITNNIPAQEGDDYIHYRLGLKYKNEGKFDQAVDEFHKVLAAYPDNYATYLQIAEIRKQQGNVRLTMYNAKKALTYNPGWGKAHKLLASAYEQDGQTQKAIMELQLYQQTCDPTEQDSVQRQIDQMLDKLRGVVTAPVSTGETAIAEPKPDSAVATPVKKKSRGPAHPKPVVTGASVAEQLFESAIDAFSAEQYPQALELLKKTLAADKRHAGASYYAGVIRYREKNRDLAVVNFVKASASPQFAMNAHYYLGRIYGEQRRYADAVAELKQYLAVASVDAGKEDAQRLLDQFLAVLRKTDAATTRKASELLEATMPFAGVNVEDMPLTEPVYSSVQIRLDSLLSMEIVDTLTDPGQAMLAGVNKFKAGQYDDAVKEFKQVLVKYPRGEVAAKSLYDIGVAYFKLHLFAQAQNQFGQLLVRFPTGRLAPQALFLNASGAFERGDSKASQQLLQKFLQEYRTHPWASYANEKLGDVLVDQAKKKEAIDAYALAAQTGMRPSDRVWSLYKLGALYLDLGNPTQAITTFTKAIELGEQKGVYVRVPDSYYKIADSYYKKKDYVKALEYYRVAVRKYPAYQETPWGYYQIGCGYQHQENYKEAIETFKLLMGKYPDDYWARQAKWQVDDATWSSEYRPVLKNLK